MKRKLGWLKDYKDFRDFGPTHPSIDKILTKEKRKNPVGASSLPKKADLSSWCSPIENQLNLGSCTAHAGVGLIEYFERRAFGHHLNSSRLFLYKVTRNLMQVTGDTGAYLRSTMGAMALFGVPPEKYWPYDIFYYENEPTAFCYSFAQSFQSLKYFQLDPHASSPDDILKNVKAFINAGFPSMFGFSVYASIDQADNSGEIPFPGGKGDRFEGGHAVVAIGYDDDKKITNTWSGISTKGAIKIRNSWGTEWGDQGYGWLPYDYIQYGIATDWWTLIKNEYIDTGKFEYE